MGFSLSLRRATAAAAPVAARVAKAAAASQTQYSSHLRTLPLRNILSRAPLSSLSAKHRLSDEDAELLKILDSEIKFASEDYKKPDKFPERFPFEVEDEKGTGVITLRRRIQREEIEVVVSRPNLTSADEYDDDDGNDEPDDDGNDDKDEGEEDGTGQFSIPLTVNISKMGGTSLEFGCTAYPDAIEIDALSFKCDRESEGEILPHEGPPFHQLDDNLQKALRKYLEKRGISTTTTNLLYEYMINKDNREYLFWLKKLRRFIEE